MIFLLGGGFGFRHSNLRETHLSRLGKKHGSVCGGLAMEPPR